MRAREVDHQRKQLEQFKFKDLDAISSLLSEEGIVMSASDVSIESPEKSCIEPDSQNEVDKKKRKLFLADEEDVETDFPQKMAHVRDSERLMTNAFYLTVASLTGHGLSLTES